MKNVCKLITLNKKSISLGFFLSFFLFSWIFLSSFFLYFFWVIIFFFLSVFLRVFIFLSFFFCSFFLPVCLDFWFFSDFISFSDLFFLFQVFSMSFLGFFLSLSFCFLFFVSLFQKIIRSYCLSFSVFSNFLFSFFFLIHSLSLTLSTMCLTL